MKIHNSVKLHTNELIMNNNTSQSLVTQLKFPFLAAVFFQVEANINFNRADTWSIMGHYQCSVTKMKPEVVKNVQLNETIGLGRNECDYISRTSIFHRMWKGS